MLRLIAASLLKDAQIPYLFHLQLKSKTSIFRIWNNSAIINDMLMPTVEINKQLAIDHKT